MASTHPTPPFWAGLDPGKPEPLDKILAALHCYQVAPPSSHNSFYFEFTVDREDHHRLADGFPELQKLAHLIHKEIPFVFDSSTGKLATMSTQKALMGLKLSIYHVIATGLESISDLPAPIGPLARTMSQGVRANDDHDHLTVFSSTVPTSVLVFTTTREPMGLGKCAHHFAQNPTLRTITVVQLALPMQLETDRQVRRLTDHSYISVFTKVNGPAVRAVVQQESLSTPGGAIKFWVSDLVKQDDVKCLLDEFTRPLYNQADDRPGNITIPYTTIVSKLRQHYKHASQTAKDMDGRAHMGGGNDFKAGGSGGSGKRSFSTLAGGNKAHKTFGSILASGTLGGGGKRSFSTMSALAGCSKVKGHNMLGCHGGSGFQSGYGAYQLPTGSAVFRGSPRMAKPAEAVLAPWPRLLARLPRKW